MVVKNRKDTFAAHKVHVPLRHACFVFQDSSVVRWKHDLKYTSVKWGVNNHWWKPEPGHALTDTASLHSCLGVRDERERENRRAPCNKAAASGNRVAWNKMHLANTCRQPSQIQLLPIMHKMRVSPSEIHGEWQKEFFFSNSWAIT